MHDSLTPSSATIDAGRLLTIERRERFSGLSLQLVDMASGADRIIDCTTRPESAGVLSERHIARAITDLLGGFYLGDDDRQWIGACTGTLASGIHSAMRDWANSGYPGMDEGEIGVWFYATLNIRAILRHSL